MLVTSASSRCLLLGPLPCWSLSTGTVGWKKSRLFWVRGPSPVACRAKPVDRANEPRKGVSAPAAVLGRTARAGPLCWSGDGVLGPGRKACHLQTQSCVFKLIQLLPRGHSLSSLPQPCRASMYSKPHDNPGGSLGFSLGCLGSPRVAEWEGLTPREDPPVLNPETETEMLGEGTFTLAPCGAHVKPLRI